MNLFPWLTRHLDYTDHGRSVLWGIASPFIVLAVFLVIVIGASVAKGHEATTAAGQPLGWRYSYACCSDKDCRPVAVGEVRETPDGYLLVKTGEVVGYQDKRIHDSPDGTFHVCQVAGDFDAGRILCIYRPSRGF